MIEPYNLDLAIRLALSARDEARASHSNYKVGACVVGRDSKDTLTYVSGYNIEFHGCPPIHAEVVAYVTSTIYRIVEYLAIVVACDGGYPMCGLCRQLYINVNPSMRVIGVDTRVNPPRVVADVKLSDLMPMAYPTWQSEDLCTKEDSTRTH